MTEDQYGTLAGVYDWIVPEPLLEPQGSVAALAAVVDELPAGARVLDCAAGTGLLAVGLAQRGFRVAATDASPAMIARTRGLADHHGVDLETALCRWEELPDQGWEAAFDAVFCVGNSLAHAAGPPGRRSALRAMTSILRDGGVLALTSRNWEREREGGSRVEVADKLTRRGGQEALLVYAWTIPEDWDAVHGLDISVAVIAGDGAVRTHGERLAMWPFRRETLHAELEAAGLTPELDTYGHDVARYLVTARR